MLTILITGGTGLVGKALTQLLVQKGYRVIVLSRKKTSSLPTDAVRYAHWDTDAQTIDKKAVEEADYIVHLAGAGVMDKRWSPQWKKEILDSRIRSSQLLVNTLKSHPNKVRAVVSASAIGWYGADKVPPVAFTEDAPHDGQFLGDTCYQWEQSVQPVANLGIRLVKLRIGIVLAEGGGALAEFKKPLRFRIAGILGHGRQVVSWIKGEDLGRLFLYAIEQEAVQGVYNAVAPAPVTNRTLTLALARAVCGRFFIPLPVPAFMLRLIVGEGSIEILKSTTVSSKKIQEAGFVFDYTNIEEAVR